MRIRDVLIPQILATCSADQPIPAATMNAISQDPEFAGISLAYLIATRRLEFLRIALERLGDDAFDSASTYVTSRYFNPVTFNTVLNSPVTTRGASLAYWAVAEARGSLEIGEEVDLSFLQFIDPSIVNVKVFIGPWGEQEEGVSITDLLCEPIDAEPVFFEALWQHNQPLLMQILGSDVQLLADNLDLFVVEDTHLANARLVSFLNANFTNAGNIDHQKAILNCMYDNIYVMINDVLYAPDFNVASLDIIIPLLIESLDTTLPERPDALRYLEHLTWHYKARLLLQGMTEQDSVARLQHIYDAINVFKQRRPDVDCHGPDDNEYVPPPAAAGNRLNLAR